MARDLGHRTKPIRPWDNEIFELPTDFWLWRMQGRPIVPTSHGPRLARRTWVPSPEVERRFGRRSISATDLIPVVRLPDGDRRQKSLALARILGIREEFSPATFRVADAKVLTERLVELYAPSGAPPETGFSLDDKVLRGAIRPAYRNLFELLVGETERPNVGEKPLAAALLLETDGAGRYRFRPGEDVLYQDRSGTRERIGPTGQLWTFILEAAPVARAPLLRLFGARLLEEALTWEPRVGDLVLNETEGVRFREGLRDLKRYVLARLQADRNEERQVSLDARRLAAFVEAATPVDGLSVTCSLGGRQLSAATPRSAFVDQEGGRVTACLRWGEVGWPPSREDAEVLAEALSDLFQLPMFEPFLALVSASSHAARMDLLRRAGAPTNLDEVMERVMEAEGPVLRPGPEPAPPRTSAPGADPDDEQLTPPGGRAADRVKVPLWRPEDLVVEGTPLVVWGTLGGGELADAGEWEDGRPVAGSVGPAGHGYGWHGTDLTALDRVGMSVAMAYEVERLRPDLPSAGLFDPTALDGGAEPMVFDVHTPDVILTAESACPSFARAFHELTDAGVDPNWPGFDILTLDPWTRMAGRLIELKSSGVNASIQTMTWNEWKSARGSELRASYWLYLVGNLRSDLAAARPFVRAIRNPFETLLSTVVSEPVRRAVQLNVHKFERSEFLEVTVKSRAT
jgi:Domain of unknown function (DUF3883)